MLYRTMMRKETSFSVNRAILLSIVVFSTIIPLLTLPLVRQLPLNKEITSVFERTSSKPELFPVQQRIEISTTPLTEKSALAELKTIGNFSIRELIQYTYLIGLSISLFFLFIGFVRIFSLSRNARWIKTEGYKVLIVDRDISAFSFSRYVILSKTDYEEHQITLLAHEQAHIRLFHFYDLALLGFAKIVHWFNPFIYLLLNDLKEIHEFQADDYTLTKGIDATQYQLLIIQKGVGSQRFALANSFNYCQIKKRIAMINKQKTRKAWNWKVATFLPMLALLLMAFGKPGENPPESKRTANLIIQKQPEIQPVKEGITNDQLTEYKVSDQSKIDTKGQVLKSNGQPVPGASVLLKGSTLGTVTDQEGKFELKGIPSDGELLIFHAGYKNKAIKATDKMMSITMEAGQFVPPPPPANSRNQSNGSGNQNRIDTKGQVLNSKGEPLQEASVLLLGSTYGTITDQEGKFELRGIPSDGELAVSSLGFRPKVLKVSNQPMKIEMETETIGTDKVSVNGKKIPPPPPALILSKMYASLLERTNPPTIFLDEVQIDKKAMDQVDIKMIQNVKIMLDQEAIDKYGDQGKNGVIQITMKSAKQKTLAE
jgi:beta-lactamase regulating signal transducer with metallopeptidase domain